MKRNLIGLLAIGLLMFLASPAYPIAISGEQTTPGYEQNFYPTGSTVNIDNGTGGPIDINYDPSKGPWQKNFWLQNNQQSLTIIEVMHVSQIPAWTDWDEQIFGGGPGGWQWVDNPAPLCQFSGNGLGQADLVGTIDALKETVVFNFTQPEVPSTILTITKTLHWSGQGAAPNSVFVSQWPTVPEPSTIVLLISGLLTLGLGYIRRRY